MHLEAAEILAYMSQSFYSNRVVPKSFMTQLWNAILYYWIQEGMLIMYLLVEFLIIEFVGIAPSPKVSFIQYMEICAILNSRPKVKLSQTL